MLFPLKCPWTGQDDVTCFFAEDDPDNADGFDLKYVVVGECFEFVGGDGQEFGVRNGFAVDIEEENVGGVEVAVFAIIGGLTDILVDDAEFCVSEETWDREDDDEDCVKGLDTGILLLQQGGKLAVPDEELTCDVEGVEELAVAFADAGVVCLLLLLPDAALTVDSCSWINIIWSPSRIVKFRGAFPDRKSTT